MKFSVIVPIYNSEIYLRECLDSILKQTFTDFELLLIDDGSTDNSAQIIEEYRQRDKRVRTYHQKNEGLAKARNNGVSKAKGDYIVFVDSDIIISSLHLYTYDRIIDSRKDADIIAFDVVSFHNTDEVETLEKKQLPIKLEEIPITTAVTKRLGVTSVACRPELVKKVKAPTASRFGKDTTFNTIMLTIAKKKYMELFL